MSGDILVSRRTILKAGTLLPLTAVGSAAVAGCAAVAPAIRPLLTYVMKSAGESFGLSIGESVANGLTALAKEGLSALSSGLDRGPSDTIYGYSSDLHEDSPMHLLVAASFAPDSPNSSWTSKVVQVNHGNDMIQIPAVLQLATSYLAARQLELQVGHLSARQRKLYEPMVKRRQRTDYAIKVYDLIEGSEQVGEKSNFRAILRNGKTIQVTWDPTTEKTLQTRVEVLYGDALQGADPVWNGVITRGIPSYELWDSESA